MQLAANGPHWPRGLMQVLNFTYRSFVLDRYNSGILESQQLSLCVLQKIMMNDLNRRDFLLRSCSSLTAIWVSSHWPSLCSAATHARQAVQAPENAKLSFFTPAQAAEIDAITARIIPTTDTPGAREAGVLYFIDRALTTFAVEQQKDYREGLPELEARAHEMFPTVERFSAATPEQQDEILHSFDDADATKPSRRPYRPRKGANTFFETVRMHTIVAFLLDPDAGGDAKGVGWTVIGREREHMFHSPFGYYDKDYAGWRPISPASGKGQS
jgi:gluconate 2-dehydrogenase gamma chain